MTLRYCVFCGSSTGRRADYGELARALGRELAGRGIEVVFGGGKVGLMGIVADAALEAGGRVIGIIPRSLSNKEVAHEGLTELRVVETMHQRKAEMVGLSDGFIALPGGMGTLEELFEVLTWAQLGAHRKPCGLLDSNGYWQALLAALDHAVAEGFVRPEHRAMVQVDSEPAALLDRFAAYVPPDIPKWVHRAEI